MTYGVTTPSFEIVDRSSNSPAKPPVNNGVMAPSATSIGLNEWPRLPGGSNQGYFCSFGNPAHRSGHHQTSLRPAYFDAFAFSDIGSNFTIQHLLSQGQTRTRFRLPVRPAARTSRKIWFSLFGMTPIAYEASIVTFGLVVVLALAQMAASLQFRTFGLALLFIGLGFAIQVRLSKPYAHIMESALLAPALYFTIAWRSSDALAFTCAALFCKPSMSYVYGLVLVVLIVMDLFVGRKARSS